MNASSPSHVLLEFARSENYELRHATAENPGLPLTVQFAIANGDARSELAENEHVAEVVLRKLAQDENSTVRARVADNPNVPGDVLAELRRDTDDFVLCVAHGGDYWDCYRALEL